MCPPDDRSAVTRRDLLRSAVGAALLGLAPRAAMALDAHSMPHAGRSRPSRAEAPYRDAALAAARWLHESRIVTPHGVTWPADPRDPTTASLDLYSGAPGIVLFLLELHAATGDRAHLDEACAGADHLIGAYPADERIGAGLYTGLAGLAYTFDRVHRASRRSAYREAAQDCLRRVHARAQSTGDGAEWSPVNDIVSGTAGTGLLLLHAARELGDRPSLELAARAGRRLLSLGRPADEGTFWPMAPTVPRLMPNFSHGTAGVAYFLASLHRATGERAFLDAALAGARHLRSIAATADGGFKVYHHDGDGTDLFYLSWCHGPAGTARLFHRLGTITGDPQWSGLVDRCARAIMRSGIPEERTAGFWNNVSQCCGNAGVAEFFLDLHRLSGNRDYLDFARRNADDLLVRATADAQGTRWVQAEHRVRPELLVAQTGFMQGAAGMGTLLLHLDGASAGRGPAIVMPDNPFGE